MRKKIICIIVCTLLITILPPTLSAAEKSTDPQITDDQNDTALPGLDIRSAWFYENPDEPHYLYTALEVQTICLKTNAVLTIRWHYNGKDYVSALDIYPYQKDIFRSGDPQKATYWQWIHIPQCEGTYDLNTNIFTWKIPKNTIGNPQKNDILTDTRATAVPAGLTSLIYFIMGRDYRDFAPNQQGTYGSNYQIQYTG
jgi:hypothetical protein